MKFGIRSATLAAIVAFGTAASAPAFADPGGCLKYGAVGAVGGHVAGHHAVIGAAGGCAAGMWRRHEYRKEQRQLAREGLAARQQHATQGTALQGNTSGTSQNGYGAAPRY